MSIEPQNFRNTLGHYPTGVCFVTSIREDGLPMGMVVGSFTSVSLSPPLVGFFAERTSASWPKIEATGRFCVNVLGEDQEEICQKLATKTADKFDGVNHRYSEAGLPILDDIVAWIDCTLHAVLGAGDHFLVLGEVHSLNVERHSRPLIFWRGGYGLRHT